MKIQPTVGYHSRATFAHFNPLWPTLRLLFSSIKKKNYRKMLLTNKCVIRAYYKWHLSFSFFA